MSNGITERQNKDKYISYLAAQRQLYEEKRKTAAEIQQLFDIYVYQMPWDNRLFGSQKNLTYISCLTHKLLIQSYFTEVCTYMELQQYDKASDTCDNGLYWSTGMP